MTGGHAGAIGIVLSGLARRGITGAGAGVDARCRLSWEQQQVTSISRAPWSLLLCWGGPIAGTSEAGGGGKELLPVGQRGGTRRGRWMSSGLCIDDNERVHMLAGDERVPGCPQASNLEAVAGRKWSGCRSDGCAEPRRDIPLHWPLAGGDSSWPSASACQVGFPATIGGRQQAQGCVPHGVNT